METLSIPSRHVAALSLFLPQSQISNLDYLILHNRYPFLLPNLAVALLAFATLPFVLLVLPETLRVKRAGIVSGESTEENPR